MEKNGLFFAQFLQQCFHCVFYFFFLTLYMRYLPQVETVDRTAIGYVELMVDTGESYSLE